MSVGQVTRAGPTPESVPDLALWNWPKSGGKGLNILELAWSAQESEKGLMGPITAYGIHFLGTLSMSGTVLSVIYTYRRGCHCRGKMRMIKVKRLLTVEASRGQSRIQAQLAREQSPAIYIIPQKLLLRDVRITWAQAVGLGMSQRIKGSQPTRASPGSNSDH